MSLKPSEILQKQNDGNLRFSRIAGVNSPDGLFDRRLLFVLGTSALQPVMHINGLYNSWPHIPQICNSLAIACLILLLQFRFVSAVLRKDPEKVKLLFETLLRFYEQEEQNVSHRLVLDKYVKMFDNFKLSYEIIVFVLLFIPNLTSWILSWYFDEFMLVAPIYLPFTDPQTLVGYIINSALFTYFSMIIYHNYASGDLAYIYYVYQCIPKINVFCMKWRKFGIDLVKVKTVKKTTIRSVEPSTSKASKNLWFKAYWKILDQEKAKEVAKVEQAITILIEDFKSYNEYLDTTIKCMELTTFAAMTINSIAIAMSFIVLLQYSKAIGACIMLFLIFEVLMPCVLGTVISYQKEKLLNELYGFQWYELSLAKQKTFLQFLHLVQNSTEYELPIMGLMDMELFTDIMNGAYSYFMYLIEFVKLG